MTRVLTGDLREREDIEELKPYTVIQENHEAPQDTPREPEDASGREGNQDREPGTFSKRAREGPGEPLGKGPGTF